MYIEKLRLFNFKNYEEVNLDFDAHINILVGKNGSGKTNLLDAIYYLSLTKSAWATSDAQCIRHAENSFMIKGDFRLDSTKSELLCSFQVGQKKVFQENQSDYPRLSDHIGKYPLVLMAPDDVDLVKEGSESRRKFFDGILSQLSKVYLDNLLNYSMALKQRNSLLRMFQQNGTVDWLAIESYDALLIKTGSYLFEIRKGFIQEFIKVFERFYTFLVDGVETTSLSYSSGLNETSFGEGLYKSRQKDLALMRTSFGVHRDDFVFSLGDGDLKRLGSQGQQKSFVIALKLAQFEILKQHKGICPLLLLDDIFDKLDDFRINRLLELIHQEEIGQLFITDARPDRTRELVQRIGATCKLFYVDKGKVEVAKF